MTKSLLVTIIDELTLYPGIPNRDSNTVNHLISKLRIEAISASYFISHSPYEHTESIAFDENSTYQKKFN